MRETLRRLAAEGRTVFVSSHHMSELEDTADHLIVIGKGRLLADISVAELLASATDGRVEIRTPDVPAAMTVLANAGATAISSGRDRVSVQGMAPARVARAPRRESDQPRRARLRQGDARGGLLLAHPRRRRAHGREDARMIRTLHSEWTKLRTQRGTLVALLTTGVLMVGLLGVLRL